ncbi:hypothetical protein B9479_005475 [Cryptococcus floricola]|uniref:NodB homology domain-containing protein n=1 Tax=Cryptococcus floricola TaxID=2591691 RepID=A0A5D3AVL4_9TREE|nr:hypothetical protein B9479_005475 [Cryptococcus floricola]
MRSFSTISLFALLTTSLANPVERAAKPQVINNCSKQGTVALTFDDGPYNFEKAVAKNLNGGKGTFFLNGNNFVCIYDRADQIKELYNAGHTIASHTWSHPDLTTLNEAQINTELKKVEDAMIKILGVKPKYFRPPYGNLNDLALKVLGQRGYTKVFLWSDDTEDANGAPASKGKQVLDGIAKDYPKPHLVLSHSTHGETANEVLPHSVPILKKAGYKLVTAGQCVGTDESPYIKVGQPGTKDASWKC